MNASAASAHFDGDLGPFPPARAENDGVLGRGLAGRRAATVRVPLQTEFARSHPAPDEEPGGRSHNGQSHQLLPVHDGNITPKPRHATKCLTFVGKTLLQHHCSSALASLPVPEGHLKIARRFNAGSPCQTRQVPQGRLKINSTNGASCIGARSIVPPLSIPFVPSLPFANHALRPRPMSHSCSSIAPSPIFNF